jgi:hypothetical protein
LRDHRAAKVAVVLTVVCAVQWLGATAAAAAQLVVVAVVPSEADRQVSMVVDVRSAGTTSVRADSFAVTVGGVHQQSRAVPVMSDQLAVGLVVDASEAGGPHLQAGLSGAANFVLEAPPTASYTVAADSSPPVMMTRLRTGPMDVVGALSGIQARGARRTSDALSMVLDELPPAADQPRVVVLYTGAPNAGGESAADLISRLTKAHVLLAVVNTGTENAYWSRVAEATGGVLVQTRTSGVIGAFDQVARLLRARYVVTLPMPDRLPADAAVRVETGEGPLTAQAVISANQDAVIPPESPPDEPSTGARLWRALGALLWLVLALAVLAIVLRSPIRAMAGRLRRPDTPRYARPPARVRGRAPVRTRVAPSSGSELTQLSGAGTDTHAPPHLVGVWPMAPRSTWQPRTAEQPAAELVAPRREDRKDESEPSNRS